MFDPARLHSITGSRMQPLGCASRRPAQRWRRSTGRGNLSRCLPKCESSWKMRAASLAVAGAVMLIGTNVARAQTTVSRRNAELYARLLAMTDSRTYDRALLDTALTGSWAPLRAAAALAVGQVGTAHG